MYVRTYYTFDLIYLHYTFIFFLFKYRHYSFDDVIIDT